MREKEVSAGGGKQRGTEMKHLEVMIRYYCSAVMSGDDEGMRNFDKLLFRGLFFYLREAEGEKEIGRT